MMCLRPGAVSVARSGSVSVAVERSQCAAVMISVMAWSVGLPCSQVSMAESSAAFWAMVSPILLTIAARSPHGVCRQAVKASRAAATAAFSSASPASGTAAMTAPVAGLRTSSEALAVAGTPPMVIVRLSSAMD